MNFGWFYLSVRGRSFFTRWTVDQEIILQSWNMSGVRTFAAPSLTVSRNLKKTKCASAKKSQLQSNDSCVSRTVSIHIHDVQPVKDGRRGKRTWARRPAGDEKVTATGRGRKKGSGDYVYEARSLCNLIAPRYNHRHSRNFSAGSHGVKWRPLFFWLLAAVAPARPRGRWGLWPRWGTTLLREHKCSKMQYPKNVNPPTTSSSPTECCSYNYHTHKFITWTVRWRRPFLEMSSPE